MRTVRLRPMMLAQGVACIVISIGAGVTSIALGAHVAVASALFLGCASLESVLALRRMRRLPAVQVLRLPDDAITEPRVQTVVRLLFAAAVFVPIVFPWVLVSAALGQAWFGAATAGASLHVATYGLVNAWYVGRFERHAHVRVLSESRWRVGKARYFAVPVGRAA